MHSKSGVAQALVLAFSALLLIPSNALQAREQGGNKKPSLSLKASPSVSFAPARIVVVAEVKGGAGRFRGVLLPDRRMGMGRLDARQRSKPIANRTRRARATIKRRYTVEHRFKNPGAFKIILRLKKGRQDHREREHPGPGPRRPRAGPAGRRLVRLPLRRL